MDYHGSIGVIAHLATHHNRVRLPVRFVARLEIIQVHTISEYIDLLRCCCRAQQRQQCDSFERRSDQDTIELIDQPAFMLLGPAHLKAHQPATKARYAAFGWLTEEVGTAIYTLPDDGRGSM